ncbi:MAG: hypothetical protein QOH33_325 [Paraburkholderia sp.]|nr:hypothetical protein [Paraburkholderia sp.]
MLIALLIGKRRGNLMARANRNRRRSIWAAAAHSRRQARRDARRRRHPYACATRHSVANRLTSGSRAGALLLRVPASERPRRLLSRAKDQSRAIRFPTRPRPETRQFDMKVSPWLVEPAGEKPLRMATDLTSCAPCAHVIVPAAPACACMAARSAIRYPSSKTTAI